ncbi:response regulator, partial [Brucella sp. 21LCYQ03]|nr:response regulator [Brucella sp. 21LCYQ03]
MRNILIADDHSIVRLGASVIISGLIKNALILQAETYEEVYQYITKQPFDLLLLDINMPGGNNIRVIKEILQIQPEL